MKYLSIKIIVALFAACILFPLKMQGQEAQPIKVARTPVTLKVTKDVDPKSKLAELIKGGRAENKFKSVEAVIFPDGTKGVMAVLAREKGEKKDKFWLFTDKGEMKYGWEQITDLYLVKIDGKDYVLAANENAPTRCRLFTPEGIDLFKNLVPVKDFEVLNLDGHIVIKQDRGQQYVFSDLAGHELWTIMADATDASIHYMPAVKAGVKTMVVSGDSIDVACTATPAGFYVSEMVGDDFYDYVHVMDEEGKKLFEHVGPDIVPYPMDGTGYFISAAEPPVYDIRTDVKEVGGEILPYRVLYMKNKDNLCSVADCNGVVLPDYYKVEYSSPDHVLYYTSLKGSRPLRGAVFLRDTALNVPPLFADVMYKVDSATQQWKAYVRRSKFGNSEPYVPGMNPDPVDLNDIERDLEYGKVMLFEVEKRCGRSHKWTKRELAYVAQCAEEEVNGDLNYYERVLNEHLSVEYVAIMSKSFFLAREQMSDLNGYKTALRIFDLAKKHEAEDGVCVMATNMKELMQRKMQLAEERAALIGERFNAFKEEHAKEIAKLESKKVAANPVEGQRRRGLASSLYERAKAKQATVTGSGQRRTSFSQSVSRNRAQRNACNAEMGVLIISSVLKNVGRVFGHTFGGSRHGLTVEMVPGGNSLYGSSVTSVPAQSSGGSAVQKSQKCGRCNGTGQCNACMGHPGYATAGDSKRKCSACHGSGRCTYCNNGYRNL